MGKFFTPSLILCLCLYLYLPLLLIPAPLCARERPVRILLYSVYKPASITFEPAKGNAFINDILLKAPTTIEAGNSLVKIKGRPPRKLARINAGSKGVWLYGGANPRRLYTGLIEITAEKNTLKIINTLSLDRYLASVVSAEAGNLSLAEAYKAQAVAARTYTIKNMRNHAGAGYNLCDSTHCQLFTGFAAIKPKAQAAADFTRNEVVTCKGKLISTFYHAVCGGRTEAIGFVWPSGHKPYLVSVKDGPEGKPYCAIAPAFNWKTRMSLKTLNRIAKALKWIKPEEEIRKMTVSERGISKRAVTIEFAAADRKVRVPATDFYHGIGRRAGWNAVRSTLFDVYSGKDYIILEGKGSGHGVGMCQWGAEGMARKGFNYRDILLHYYPGTRITYD
ncbi:MAG: SpoIID/LytB domain-containing protein [Elusimicrobia bacterium]|nr:SpoIID/LytB domain-containing protein [Elusimicrobiota bacterium]